MPIKPYTKEEIIATCDQIEESGMNVPILQSGLHSGMQSIDYGRWRINLCGWRKKQGDTFLHLAGIAMDMPEMLSCGEAELRCLPTDTEEHQAKIEELLFESLKRWADEHGKDTVK